MDMNNGMGTDGGKGECRVGWRREREKKKQLTVIV